MQDALERLRSISYRMKILMISFDRNLFMEGTDVRERMIKYGHLVEELHIIVFSKNSLDLSEQKISENTWIYPTNSFDRWFYVWNAVSIGKKLLATRFTPNTSRWLVAAQDPFETGLAGYRIAKRFKIGLQLQVHTDFLNPHFIHESKLNKARVKIATFLIPKATCIRVVSHTIRSLILRRFPHIKPSAITILPVFVDLAKIKTGDPSLNLHEKYPQFDFIILMVARLEHEKNIPLAIQALKNILPRHPKTGLVIVGEGSEKIRLKKLALSEKILENNVVFEGWRQNLPSYYKTADMLLVTSNYEGFGRMFIEAASVGCPIVTTNVGIARELILDDESSFICSVGNESCITQNIARLIEHESVRRVYALKLEARAGNIVTTDEQSYLDRYKASWENCL